ncbi:MAG: hypothetical protein ACW986_09955 [Promethearchaeota archaeon]|jgi:hypothetical protein
MLVIIAAIISVVIFIVLSIFQILLAAGLSLGRFAYGGKHETLPKNLRIMSIIAVGIFIFGLISVLIQAELFLIIPNSLVFLVVVWILAFYLAFNTLTNLMSRSKSEKYVMTPISLILTICLFIIAISS